MARVAIGEHQRPRESSEAFLALLNGVWRPKIPFGKQTRHIESETNYTFMAIGLITLDGLQSCNVSINVLYFQVPWDYSFEYSEIWFSVISNIQILIKVC